MRWWRRGGGGGKRFKLNAVETKNDRVMTAPESSQWLWVSLSIRNGEEGRLCDYPSTNSRAQSGHHGPGKTCNHAVLQHLPPRERGMVSSPAGTREPLSIWLNNNGPLFEPLKRSSIRGNTNFSLAAEISLVDIYRRVVLKFE